MVSAVNRSSENRMLQGKVALVTGASSGIGRATAMVYAREGARVVASDVNQADGEQTVALIREQGGDAIFVAADVSRPEDCSALVDRAVAHFGQLDAACNNAGISGHVALLADYPLEAWQQMISVNLSGVFYCMKYQIPAMLKAGGGAIVNLASVLGTVALAGSSAYTAAKHGVVGLTKAAALEYGGRGIRVNSVGPAYIETPMTAGPLGREDLRGKLLAAHPIGRFGRPQEVAELIVWLSSSRASFVTGGYYPVDGGFLTR
jgi:NAD(P)-dependent dehydrogenase (short-subunit alcohol dehydrogenase family)